MNSVKRMIKHIPVLGPALQRTAGLAKKQPAFLTSSQYWEDRYKTGGNSGAGSYNRLAQFKSEVLNEFVRRAQVISVMEFGCGDGAQLSRAEYPVYTGVDVSAKAVNICREHYRNDPAKKFFTTDTLPAEKRADLVLSLDVIYHLVEDRIFDAYMRQLFQAARRFVIIYSSNQDREWTDKHVRHRQFTRWVKDNEPGWTLSECIKNKYPFDPDSPDDTSFADFYIYILSGQPA